MEEDGDEEPSEPVFRKPHHLLSVQEQLAHRITHVPYRKWCAECVAGRKPNHGHATGASERDATSIPEVHLDYCFMRNKPQGESVPVIVLKDRDSRSIAAHVVPYKGGDLEWAVKQSARDLGKW